MKLNLCGSGVEQHVELLKKHISRRIPTESAVDGMQITLTVDPLIGAPESYRIEGEGSVWKIVGSDSAGLYYGIGKFLHTARWTEADFAPRATGRVVTPACSFRAIYFAAHLYNWYVSAPVEEISDYVEELMLWGYNALFVIVPVIGVQSAKDPLFPAGARLAQTLFAHAKRLSMCVGLFIPCNQGFEGAPHEFDADPSFDPIGNVRGNLGRNLCPAKPGVVEYLKERWNETFALFFETGIDYIVTWPYDEGGCGCAACRPWGAKGYPDMILRMRKEALKYFPKVRFIVSTWTFDRPDDQGEYEGLYRRLSTDLSFVDAIMVDAHGDYPRYPLEHPVIKPIVNFPEISMYGLYPWGGYGANPLPDRFHRIWNSSKQILDGGAPYSEGMYEDISKVQMVGYYWEPDRTWEDILAEYIRYEYSSDVVEEILSVMRSIERNHVRIAENDPSVDFAAADEADRTVRSVEKCLSERAKKSWRWRILYIRAVLDKKRYDYMREHLTGKYVCSDMRSFGSDFLVDDEEAQACFRELRRYYYSVEENGWNRWTLPVVGGNTKRGSGTYKAICRKRAEKQG